MTLYETVTSSVAYSARKHGKDERETVERWLNDMTPAELLRAISDALDEMKAEEASETAP